MTTHADVIAALDTVRDPELDTSIVELEFVSEATVSGAGVARVRLRLPTFFCAPNFAFLMVADAYDAVSAVPGVTQTEIVLEDHFAAPTINEGVAARAGFVRTFDGEAVDELHELRAFFIRKAMLAGQDRVARPLLADGFTPDDLARATLGDVPPTDDRERLRERRRELGIPADDQAALLVDEHGAPITPDGVPLHLRRVRSTRVNIEANTGQCLSLLAARYPDMVKESR
ncbi:iron-sulfur cluster assembly protein [Pseudonocardia eucalypti]|uniref:Iron-sulfur cluster assembly protein n=1 Tax=Pseudonocardia eucalypti TaxID=648755 RepID=A0ABP9R457_9PSEU|nr:metal-sulfur cluster biosynthetic enzyme [Pseudonocardia eucalypti]